MRVKRAVKLLSLVGLLVGVASCSPSLTSNAVERSPAPAETSPTSAEAAPETTFETAVAAGVIPGPAIESLLGSSASTLEALRAFRVSCPSLLKREDVSQLTRNQDWEASCTAATAWRDEDAAAFFSTHFEAVQVGEGEAFATGYFEPQIAGSRVQTPGYAVPVYGRPPELVEADLGLFSPSLKDRRIRGRVDKQKLVPFHDRAAIEDGALSGRGLEIAWAADPVDLFFLEIQGSGRLALPNGEVMRIGYASQNGRDYVPIGRLMKERGLLGPGQTSMQAITAWLRAHPKEGRALMRENKSYIFFTEVKGPGPHGALGLPVTPRATVAADPKFVPLGAPVMLAMDQDVVNHLWVAQDTGGAIKGANRFDTFWGAGDEAARIAGGMAAKGRALILLPKGTVARLQAQGNDGSQARR